MKQVRLLLLLSCFVITELSYAQVTSVSLHDNYDEVSNTYTMQLIVNEGEALTAIERIQFNAQITVISPEGNPIKIIESIEPLQGNSEPFSGTTPTNWKVGVIVETPEVTPAFSYFAVTPTLSPTARYNQLVAGQCIDLFTYRAEGCTDDCARLYINGSDPTSEMAGMNGADLTIGFTIGNLNPIFEGIDDNPLCLISSTADLGADVDIYPNPASNFITISAASEIQQVQVTDMQGRVLSTIPGKGLTELQVDLVDILAGTYAVLIHTSKGRTQQVINKL